MQKAWRRVVNPKYACREKRWKTMASCCVTTSLQSFPISSGALQRSSVHWCILSIRCRRLEFPLSANALSFRQLGIGLLLPGKPTSQAIHPSMLQDDGHLSHLSFCKHDSSTRYRLHSFHLQQHRLTSVVHRKPRNSSLPFGLPMILHFHDLSKNTHTASQER